MGARPSYRGGDMDCLIRMRCLSRCQAVQSIVPFPIVRNPHNQGGSSTDKACRHGSWNNVRNRIRSCFSFAGYVRAYSLLASHCAHYCRICFTLLWANCQETSDEQLMDTLNGSILRIASRDFPERKRIHPLVEQRRRPVRPLTT